MLLGVVPRPIGLSGALRSHAVADEWLEIVVLPSIGLTYQPQHQPGLSRSTRRSYSAACQRAMTATSPARKPFGTVMSRIRGLVSQSFLPTTVHRFWLMAMPIHLLSLEGTVQRKKVDRHGHAIGRA